MANPRSEGASPMSDGQTTDATVEPERLLLSPREAARSLSVSERTLYSLMKSGELTHVRIGRLVRYPRAELEAWIRQRTERAGVDPKVA